MKQVINKVRIADFDDEGSTVSVTVTTSASTETFHVQTVDGEYRPSLGCLIIADGKDGGIDPDEYPSFDLSEIVCKAEEFAESGIDGDENLNYFNKDASPYTRRFIVRD